MTRNDINDRFNTWLSHKKDYESILKIHPRDLNQRFYLLKRPFNSHCKVNYVDYNCIVDQILQMSLPYCESKSSSNNNKIVNQVGLIHNINFKNSHITSNDQINTHLNNSKTGQILSAAPITYVNNLNQQKQNLTIINTNKINSNIIQDSNNLNNFTGQNAFENSVKNLSENNHEMNLISQGRNEDQKNYTPSISGIFRNKFLIIY